VVLQGLLKKFRKKGQPHLDFEQRIRALGNVSGEEVRQEIGSLSQVELSELILARWPHLSNELQGRIKEALHDLGIVRQWLEDCTHRDLNRRLAAIERIGITAPEGSGPVLLELLGSKDEATQLAAVRALSNMVDVTMVELLVSALDKPKQYLPARVAQVLVNFGMAATPGLMEAYSFSGPKKKQYIIEILAQISDDRSMQVLLAALEDTEDGVRVQAALALGRMGLPQGIEPLIKALGDESPKVRARAAKALGMLKAEVAATALQEAAMDNDWLVRGNAQEALAVIMQSS